VSKLGKRIQQSKSKKAQMDPANLPYVINVRMNYEVGCKKNVHKTRIVFSSLWTQGKNKGARVGGEAEGGEGWRTTTENNKNNC